ncbi:Chondroitinase-AC [Grifola frondosa]|uniref:Chondroitinase-AC n=1 Tax=Grifola frondosa TaxID=5627 RepID=A0A1C7MQN6_GRIFR|nr:Chondroitinase-AC [Grifola frondosa]
MYRSFRLVAAAATGCIYAIAATAIPAARNLDAATLADIQTVTEGRLSTIVGGTTGATSISSWLSSLGSNGQWPSSEVDYTAGCDAPTANWAAQEHWERILTFASAWHGGLENAQQFVQSIDLRSAISLAMGFWFANDFSDPSCLDSGGDAACPCGTPGLWNTNWFSNVIGIPTFVGEVCLLLNNTLTPTELGNCTKFTGRSYATFETGINGGLLTINATLLADAFGRVHADAVVQNATKADGIRADGSFGQHTGIVYNGNYGKDYENDLFSFEIEAGGTQFQAGPEARSAVETLVDGDQWMIYRNVFTNVLHWDFSVLGRFLTDPVIDNHASSSINTNLTQLQVLGQEWGSDILTNVFDDLSLNTTDANSGNLTGNRMFYANDFMVQRGPGYVTSLRMYSTRTQNTECTDEANPFGFHLSDGTVYNHLQGDEYEDIVAAWDWNLIPGITVDYNATTLDCSDTGRTAIRLSWAPELAEDMVLPGERCPARDGGSGSRLPPPHQFSRCWISASMSVTCLSMVLLWESGNFTDASSLWHGGVGYIFNTSDPVSLSLDIGPRTGAWTAIGASSQPPVTVDMFAHGFQAKASATKLQSIRNDGSISALLDETNEMAMLVFWETDGGQVTVPSPNGAASIKVQSSGSANVIFRMDTWTVTVAEPTQTLSALTLNFTLGSGSVPIGWGSSESKGLSFDLPSGGIAGSSLTQTLPS